LQSWFSRRGRDQKVVVGGNFNANNGDILCGAAASRLGVILQPTFLAHELLRDGRLVRILDGWEPEGYTIYAVYPSRQFLTPKVRSFIDFLIDRFGDNPYWDKLFV
jgi:DNA-binding transcriptional LysR family regulator